MKNFVALICAALLLVTSVNALAFACVGNSNTRKFHRADCHMVGKMNPAHKVPFNTREEAVATGYVPCKRCNP